MTLFEICEHTVGGEDYYPIAVSHPFGYPMLDNKIAI